MHSQKRTNMTRQKFWILMWTRFLQYLKKFWQITSLKSSLILNQGDFNENSFTVFMIVENVASMLLTSAGDNSHRHQHSSPTSIQPLQSSVSRINNFFKISFKVFPTPYGGRIDYQILGTLFSVHLKDKQHIRKGKRWSQVMYLYYLIGWKIDTCYLRKVFLLMIRIYILIGWFTVVEWLRLLWIETRKSRNGEPIKKENSFILALDGDVKFSPIDFELVLDRLCSNDDVAACCNQIHPAGKGPIVMFQRFEYAVGHWFGKSAEHVLGCVLCSPGCFSLIRISNLMKNNVMAQYRDQAKCPREKLMYDQGQGSRTGQLGPFQSVNPLSRWGSLALYTAAIDWWTNRIRSWVTLPNICPRRPFNFFQATKKMGTVDSYEFIWSDN